MPANIFDVHILEIVNYYYIVLEMIHFQTKSISKYIIRTSSCENCKSSDSDSVKSKYTSMIRNNKTFDIGYIMTILGFYFYYMFL